MLAKTRQCWRKQGNVGENKTMLAKTRQCWQKQDNVGKNKTMLAKTRQCWQKHVLSKLFIHVSVNAIVIVALHSDSLVESHEIWISSTHRKWKGPFSIEQPNPLCAYCSSWVSTLIVRQWLMFCGVRSMV